MTSLMNYYMVDLHIYSLIPNYLILSPINLSASNNIISMYFQGLIEERYWSVP